MPEDTPATAVPTAQPVSAAQSGFTTFQPAQDVNAAVKAELRIRDLQSEADKRRADAERIAAEKAALEAELASLKASQSSVLDGAARVATEAIHKVQALEAAMERERAERMKAEALMSEPDLRPYAPFIPATTDANALQQQIAAFKQARAQDPAFAPPSPAPSAPANPYALYPNGHQPAVPAAQPARPAPTAGNAPDVRAAIETKMAAALAANDTAAFNAAVAESARMWDAARQA